MIAIGHLVGYGMGTVDLVKVFGTTLGDSQFKQLTILAAAFFIFAICLTSWAVQERVLISSRYASFIIYRHCYAVADMLYRDGESKSSAIKMISKILKTTMHLPDRIQAICWVQFWAWIGIYGHIVSMSGID